MNYFDDLKNIDKVRLAINLLERDYFNVDYDTDDIIALLTKYLD